MSRVVWDVRSRLAFYDKPIFASFEDKHLFTRRALTDAADCAGFRQIGIHPCHVDANGLSGAIAYVREADIHGKSADYILEAYVRYAAHYFRRVPVEDRTAMYLCCFRR